MFFSKKKKFYPGKTKNIVVTGGAGFLGSHLCDRLVKKNDNVICIDSLIGGGTVNNIKHLLQKPNFVFIKHDINQQIDLEQIAELKSFRIDIHGIQEVYHLACPTSIKNFNKLKIHTLYANSVGVINTLELARKYGAKFLFTSSSVVYGPRKNDKPFVKENDLGLVNFIGPRSCYDEGKRFAETIVTNYRDAYNMDVKIARVFRTYGPREALFDGQMVPDFVLQALNNKPLVIYGEEGFSTSLCFIDDMIQGMIKLMDSKENIPINLGYPEEYKLAEFAQKIIEKTNSQSKVEFRGALPFTSPLSLPDISLARERLGWFPVTRLEDGLEELIDYVKANKMLLQPLVDKYDQS